MLSCVSLSLGWLVARPRTLDGGSRVEMLAGYGRSLSYKNGFRRVILDFGPSVEQVSGVFN